MKSLILFASLLLAGSGFSQEETTVDVISVPSGINHKCNSEPISNKTTIEGGDFKSFDVKRCRFVSTQLQGTT